MSDVKRAWMVSVGSYSDYQVLAVALTREDAQRWADAYTASRESLYRDAAEIEEVELYEDGGPLPHRLTYWNADAKREWEITEIASHRDESGVRYNPQPGRGPLAVNYPTRESARAAVDEAMRDAEK